MLKFNIEGQGHKVLSVLDREFGVMGPGTKVIDEGLFSCCYGGTNYVIIFLKHLCKSYVGLEINLIINTKYNLAK